MAHTDEDGEPWTFATTRTGDLNITEQNTIQTVHGHEQTTLQDLKVALSTYKGEDPRDREFGLHVFETFESLTALKREIRKTLEYDDYRHERVTSIRRIELYGTDSRQDVAVEVTLSLEEEPEDITLVFDLFTNQLSITGGPF